MVQLLFLTLEYQIRNPSKSISTSSNSLLNWSSNIEKEKNHLIPVPQNHIEELVTGISIFLHRQRSFAVVRRLRHQQANLKVNREDRLIHVNLLRLMDNLLQLASN